MGVIGWGCMMGVWAGGASRVRSEVGVTPTTRRLPPYHPHQPQTPTLQPPPAPDPHLMTLPAQTPTL